MATTFTWNGGSGFGNVGTNWTPSGPPVAGDTAIVNSGTVMLVNGELSDNLLELNAGTFQLSNTIGSFFTLGNTIVSGFDNRTTLLAGTIGPAALDVFGDFVNEGTIEAIGNTLTVAISAYVTSGVSLAGTLLNQGVIEVLNGATLDVTGTGTNTLAGGDVVVANGTAVVTAPDVGSGFTLGHNATLDLDSATSKSSVTFGGTADLLALNSTALSSTLDVSGFTYGDTLDIGAHEIGTIVYEYAPSGGTGSSGPGVPILTIIGTSGGTLLSDPFSDPQGNLVSGSSGLFTPQVLASGVTGIGPFEIATAGNGDTLLEVMPPSTWQWTGADPGNLSDPLNFELLSGPGNTSEVVSNGTVYGNPYAGDTVFANDATLAFPLDNTLNGNTIFATGTSELSFVGNQTGVVNVTTSSQNGISYKNPTIDSLSVISNDPPPLASTTLNFAGYNVNEGTLISNAGAGSSLTINVTPGTAAAGYLINYGDIEADAGNTVTISVAGTSELFNANLVYANGGTVIINGGNGIAGGYAPMLGGIALIGDGGTIELNAGFPSGTQGSSPAFAFYDGDSGDTLILNQIGQFGGRILGFQRGDTIDLGSDIAIGKIAVTADGQVLLENNKGGVLDTLVLSSGDYNTGTFAVTAAGAGTLVADGFTLTTGGDGDTLLTTDVVNSVWNNTSGIWQTASAWSTGVVPGPTSTAVIGVNPTAGATGSISPFVITTGSTAVVVNSLVEVNNNATLQITSATTVGTSTNLYGLQQIAGEIEVTGGNALTVQDLKQDSPGADLQIDPGGVLDILGHSNLGFANHGTLSETTVVNGTPFANGNSLALFITGTATVDDGLINAGPVTNASNGSVISTGGLIDIGLDGGGTPSAMTVENGSTVVATYTDLSSNPTSFGMLTLTGAGTTWNDAGDPTDALNTRGYMLVGHDNQSGNQPSPSPAGTAQLVIENGATLNEALYAKIGNSLDSAGSATITSGGVWNVGTSSAGGFLQVGNAGSGTLDIDGGTVNVLPGNSIAAGGFGAAGTYTSNGTLNTNSAGLAIARQAGSDGTVDVSGGGELNITIFPTITGSGVGVGQAGHGVLDIFDQGTVSITNGGISAGNTLGIGDGTIIVGSGDGQSALLIAAGDTLSAGMGVGKGGTGTLYVNAGGTVEIANAGTGTLSNAGINVGLSAGAYGYAEINGGLVENTTGGLIVGNAGTGTVDLLNSGTISLTNGGIDVGLSAGAQGLLEIASGGMLTSTTNGIEVGINAGSTGTLEVMAGGIYNVSTHGIGVGVSAGASGTIVVDGPGALINISAGDSGYSVGIGEVGAGFLTVENNGTFSAAGASIDVGQNAGGAGTVAVASGGLITTSGTQGISIGQSGTGVLTIGVGGTVSAANFFNIAQIGTASSGAVIVNGGTLDDSGVFNVGNAGSGALVVEGGGLVDQTGINFQIGGGSGSRGTVVVNGGTLDARGNFEVGGSGAGTLTIDALSVVNDGTGVIGIGNGGTSGTGTAAVNGGTLLGDSLAVGGFGVGTLTVSNGGQIALNNGTASGIGIGSGPGGTGSGFMAINSGTVAETGNGVTVGGTNESGSLVIGTLGELITTGTTAIFAGGTFLPVAGQINASGSGSAAVTVNGGTWIANGQLVVAGTGSGALTINGGLVNAGTNTVAVGNGSGGAGTLTVGPGTLLAGALQVAAPFSGTASGVVTIATGGTVDTGSLTEGSGGAVTVNGSLAATGGFGISVGQSGVGPSALTVNSGGTVSDAGFLTVGSGGAGSLLVLTGGAVKLTGGSSFVLGLNPGGGGAVTLDGGILNAGSSNISLGSVAGSTGALTVESGGTLSGGGFTVGTSGSSAATVTGTGSRFSNTGEFIVGDGGLGSLSIESGATVVTAPGVVPNPAAVIANQSGAAGSEVDVTGAGSDWQITGTLQVGNAAQGALDIASGATVTATSLVAAAQSGGDGVITVAGTNSLLQLTGSLALGAQGAGELSILSGATASALDLTIGGSPALSSGNVDVEGAGSELSIATGGALNIGVASGGGGVLTIGSDAVLNFAGIPTESGHASFNNYGTVDPDGFEYTTASNGNAGLNLYDLYIGNIGAVQVSAGTSTWFTPMVLTGTSVADAANNIDNNGDVGEWQLSNDGTLVFNANTVDAGQAIVFEDATDTLVIGQVVNGGGPGISGVTPTVAAGAMNLLAAGGFAAELWGYQAGDQILFDNLVVNADSIVGGNTLELFGAGGALLGELTFYNKAGTRPLGSSGMDAAAAQMECFAAGTRVLTARGEVAVEAIAVGERVRVLLGDAGDGAAGDGLAEVVWVGRREVDCARHREPRKVWPVRVAAGAFGEGRPHTDLWLSPDHAVYVGEVLDSGEVPDQRQHDYAGAGGRHHLPSHRVGRARRAAGGRTAGGEFSGYQGRAELPGSFQGGAVVSGLHRADVGGVRLRAAGRDWAGTGGGAGARGGGRGGAGGRVRAASGGMRCRPEQVRGA